MPDKQLKPPDGYAFLLAAGEIDFRQEKRFSHVRRCGHELMRISQMNGSYEKLPQDFKDNVRATLQQECDNSAAQKLGELGQQLLNVGVKRLTSEELRHVRGMCSAFATWWPMEPRILLIRTKAKVPD